MNQSSPFDMIIGSPLRQDLLAVDWSSTPLGAPATWDRSLVTMVRTVMTSRFAMWMAWGPELTFFCNDAYRRDTLGTKYPWALGRPAREVWAEIWNDIGPRIAHVLETGAATWDESLQLFLERSGYTEETYHTFSYSPLTDDAGEIAGMLCVVSEETERVIGERRMATLRGVGSEPISSDPYRYLRAASRHLAANPRSLPFTLGYLFDDKGCARLASWTGIRPPHPAAPTTIALDQADPVWPVRELRGGRPITDDGLERRFEQLPTGEWQRPPHTAVALPLPASARTDPPAGFLVVGTNRHRPLDDAYLAFLRLLAAQLASGVSSARAYEAERLRAEQLAELDRTKTAFFTNVSHELRTPLTLLLGPAEDALSESNLESRQQARFEMIARNGQRLLKLVGQLLDFSRLESGRLTAAFQPVDLAAYTAELASMFESAMADAGLAFAVDCAEVAEPVYIDPEMWAKIVLNLLSNALKFTVAGSVALTLTRTPEWAVLTVRDTGIGIRAEDHAGVFERFRQVLDAGGRTHEGSGIGLALVSELAAIHGGRVELDSELGSGSAFKVQLPLGRDHLPSDQIISPEDELAVAQHAAGFLAELHGWTTGEEHDQGPPVASAAPIDRPRVLVVDDNADMRDYVSGLLRAEYDVETAGDGQEALEIARIRRPDLVLSDVNMPRMNGFALLAALRTDPATMHVPLVMLSARAGEDGIVEGLEAGADDYLIKPFSSRELLARVSANLELDRVRRTGDQLQHSLDLQNRAERLAKVGSWEISLADGHIRASEHLVEMLGLASTSFDAPEDRLWIDRFIHPDDRARVQQTVRSGVSAGMPFECEARLRGDSDPRWIRLRGEVVLGESGTAVAVRGYMQDITAQREAERAIAVAAAAEKAAEFEHSVADALQRSLLPDSSFVSSHLAVSSFYRAGVEGTRAGGDFYDAIDLGAGRVALVIGDVTGRGVHAASMMGQLRAAIHAYARLDLPPAEVLGLLDDLVLELCDGRLVTCIYGVFDPVERRFTYANAGHLPPLIATTAAPPAPIAGATGPPLGAGFDEYGEHRVTIEPGSRIVLYTDGLIERRGEDLEVSIARLAQQVDRRAPLADLAERLIHAVHAGAVDDDVAILIAEPRTDHEHDTAELVLPAKRSSVADARRFVDDVTSDWHLPANRSADAILVASELATNAILHGAEPICLRLRHDGVELTIEVDDAASAMPRKLPHSVERSRGRGLALVDAVSSRWAARGHDHGKTVWATLSLPSTNGRSGLDR